MKLALIAASILSLAVGIAGTHAQEHKMAAMGASLPAACMPAEMPAMGEMPAMKGMDEAHQALMDTMKPMHNNMMAGMMAEDIDVAFVCGMIPHHQSAIDMAKVELMYGDDPWARELAQKIIDAQEAEIAEMTKWLEENAR